MAADTGIPAGRVRKILLSAERLRPSLQPGAVQAATAQGDAMASGANGQASATSPGAAATASDDPLRWYPIGANGRLRPPQPPELQP